MLGERDNDLAEICRARYHIWFLEGDKKSRGLPYQLKWLTFQLRRMWKLFAVASLGTRELHPANKWACQFMKLSLLYKAQVWPPGIVSILHKPNSFWINLPLRRPKTNGVTIHQCVPAAAMGLLRNWVIKSATFLLGILEVWNKFSIIHRIHRNWSTHLTFWILSWSNIALLGCDCWPFWLECAAVRTGWHAPLQTLRAEIEAVQGSHDIEDEGPSITAALIELRLDFEFVQG